MKTIVATIGCSSEGFIAAARSRPDAELWEVTPSNREALVERVLTWLRHPLGNLCTGFANG
jgi:nucleoside-triphosphatase THEP1